jgi:hypothetical protein
MACEVACQMVLALPLSTDDFDFFVYFLIFVQPEFHFPRLKGGGMTSARKPL